MKRILFSIFAMLAIGSTAYGDELKVEDLTVSTSENTALIVNLTSDVKSFVESVTFNIKVPDGVEFTSDGENLAYKFGPDFSGSFISNIQDDGSYMITVASDNALRGRKGLLFALQVKASTSFTEGQKLDDGQIYNIMFSSTENGKTVKTHPSDRTFKIEVTNRIVLDENSPYNPPAVRSKNFLVKRTLIADRWSTICLPFTISDPEEVFGAGVKVAEFTGCAYDETNGINIGFTTTDDGMTYGTPYLIKVASDISQFTIDGVRCYSTPQTEQPEQDFDSKVGYGMMSGHFPLTTMNQNDLFIQENTFYYAVAGQTIKGFRAVFNFYDNDENPLLISESAGTRAMFSVNGKSIGDGTTGIDSYKVLPKNGKVFSLTGKYMGEKENLKSLPKGVYILDGIKVVNQ